MNNKLKIGIALGVICLWLFLSFVIYSIWGKHETSSKDTNAEQAETIQIAQVEEKDSSEEIQTSITNENITKASLDTTTTMPDENNIDYVMGKIVFEDAKKTESAIKNSEGKVIGSLDGTKFWLTSQVGYNARMVDKAMSEEFRELYKSEDGGATWNDMAPLPSTWPLKTFSFVSDNLGFFSFKWVEGKNTNFYRTENSGATFDEIILPVIQVEYRGDIYTPFNTPEAPWKEDGILYMYYAQDENGDYRGGTCKALLKSEDDGKTWIFTYKIVNFKNYNG